MRILLVDDDPAMRVALRRFLERNGHQIVGEAHDGAEGLAAARASAPDLVIMDLRMPNMTGTEAARLLRKTNPDIAVIIHSAFDERGFKTVAEKAGVVRYVVKGDGPGELLAAIRQLDEQAGPAPAGAV